MILLHTTTLYLLLYLRLEGCTSAVMPNYPARPNRRNTHYGLRETAYALGSTGVTAGVTRLPEAEYGWAFILRCYNAQ